MVDLGKEPISQYEESSYATLPLPRALQEQWERAQRNTTGPLGKEMEAGFTFRPITQEGWTPRRGGAGELVLLRAELEWCWKQVLMGSRCISMHCPSNRVKSLTRLEKWLDFFLRKGQSPRFTWLAIEVKVTQKHEQDARIAGEKHICMLHTNHSQTFAFFQVGW